MDEGMRISLPLSPQFSSVFFEGMSWFSVLEATFMEGRSSSYSSSEKMVDVGCSMPVVSYLSFALIATNTLVTAVNLAIANNNDQNNNNNLNTNVNGRRRRKKRMPIIWRRETGHLLNV